MFAWALMGFANVYRGFAQRALDLTVPAIKGISARLRGMLHAPLRGGMMILNLRQRFAAKSGAHWVTRTNRQNPASAQAWREHGGRLDQ